LKKKLALKMAKYITSRKNLRMGRKKTGQRAPQKNVFAEKITWEKGKMKKRKRGVPLDERKRATGRKISLSSQIKKIFGG